MVKSLKQQAIDAGITGPSGEPAWYWVPGYEMFTKATLPSDAPSPSSSAVWPLERKRPLIVRRFVAGKGPNGPASFGYKRINGGRAHAGVDLCANYKDWVVAVEDGKIVSFYYFYDGVYALFVDHGSYVVNYGEVDATSIDVLGLKSPLRNYAPNTSVKSTGYSGSSVKAGQRIAFVGKMKKSSMLHFEMYTSGTKSNKQWAGWPTGAPPSGLYNPTNFLLILAQRKLSSNPSSPENAITQTLDCT